MSKSTDPVTRNEVLSLDSSLEALRVSPEFEGPVESLDGHHCNDHFALVYETKTEQLEAIVPFLRQGLERGEQCMYVLGDLGEEVVVEALREAGVDVDAARESGALSFHSVAETYLRNGTFEPDEMIEFYADAIEEATAEYEALRVVAETTWLQRPETTVEDFMAYEAKVNDLFDGEDCIALCQYDRNAFDPAVVDNIVQTHPHLIYENTVCHNFYHTPPREYFSSERHEREVDRKLNTLLERTRAKSTLEQRDRFLQDLYAIAADPDHSFDEKIQALFDLGCDVFGMELGAMARVDPGTDRFVIERIGQDHEYLEPGLELELSETYCRATVDAGGPACVTDPEQAGYEDAAALQEFGLQSYLGTHVTVPGGDNRTFFFVTSQPREDPVTETERLCLDLMAQWVEYELERQQRERFLRGCHEITADPDHSFDEKLEQLLDLACEWTGLDAAGLTHLPEWGGEFLSEYTLGYGDDADGDVWTDPDEGCYCRAVITSDEPVGKADVRGTDWEDDEIHQEHGLTCYLGTKVTDGSAPYGTLWVGSTEPRDRAFTETERTFLDLLGQWVSYELERVRREAQLAALNEMSRDLMSAEDRTDIAEHVVANACETLDLPLTGIAYYDGRTGDLSPVAATPRAEDELPMTALCERGTGDLWEAFVANEIRVLDDVAATPGSADDITEVLAVPLEQQGVFVAGTTAPEGFGDAECDFVETTAATVEAACTRADRERQLHEREETLADQNETLGRLNRINDIIRSIDQGLVDATTRAEIEELVCEHLANTGPYELAWIGEHDALAGEVTPKESAGTEKGYLDDIAITTDDGLEARGPTGRAVRTREPQVVNDFLDDARFEPWRQDALNRGYHASIALPLVYEGSLYGVLNVYAGQPGVFDELERTVLAELSDTIAYAINAVESKKALVSDEVVELEFEVSDTAFGTVDLIQEVGCELSLVNLVPQSDGGLRAFFSTRGCTADEVLDAASRLPASDVSLVSEETVDGEQICLFESTLTDDSIGAIVLEHGGQLRDIDAADGSATVTVHLAGGANVREFVEMLTTRYPGSELVAQRSHEQPNWTLTEFRAALTEELTPRQLEVLQTAYFSGYFEEPRQRTASEIADTLDIAQPTFTSHLRTAHRKLWNQLLDEETLLG